MRSSSQGMKKKSSPFVSSSKSRSSALCIGRASPFQGPDDPPPPSRSSRSRSRSGCNLPTSPFHCPEQAAPTSVSVRFSSPCSRSRSGMGGKSALGAPVGGSARSLRSPAYRVEVGSPCSSSVGVIGRGGGGGGAMASGVGDSSRPRSSALRDIERISSPFSTFGFAADDLSPCSPMPGLEETSPFGLPVAHVVHGPMLNAAGAQRTALAGSEERCPQLVVGSTLDKTCPLRANEWVRVGRHPETQILLNDSAVSGHHCQFRWDKALNVVELLDTSVTGTKVNGEVVRGSRVELSHGDMVRVKGRASVYQFLLDLRRVDVAARAGLRGGDFLDANSWGAALKKKDREEKQNRHLKLKMSKLNKAEQQFEAEAHQLDESILELTTKRMLQLSEEKMKKEQLNDSRRLVKELRETLEASRKEWERNLEEQQRSNDAATHILFEKVGLLQEKILKLQEMKDELERSFHPEKFGDAQLDQLGGDLFGGDPSTHSAPNSVALQSSPARVELRADVRHPSAEGSTPQILAPP